MTLAASNAAGCSLGLCVRSLAFLGLWTLISLAFGGRQSASGRTLSDPIKFGGGQNQRKASKREKFHAATHKEKIGLKRRHAINT